MGRVSICVVPSGVYESVICSTGFSKIRQTYIAASLPSPLLHVQTRGTLVRVGKTVLNVYQEQFFTKSVFAKTLPGYDRQNATQTCLFHFIFSRISSRRTRSLPVYTTEYFSRGNYHLPSWLGRQKLSRVARHILPARNPQGALASSNCFY